MDKETLKIIAETTGALTTEQVTEDALAVYWWVLQHQSCRESVVSLNPQQYKQFNKTDLVGALRLPDLIKRGEHLKLQDLLKAPGCETIERTSTDNG